MKRITLFVTLALLLGAASAAFGSEATVIAPKVKGGRPTAAPWVTGYCLRILNPAATDTSGIHALYNCYPTGTDTTYTFSTAEKAAFAVESAKAAGGRSLVVQSCDIDGSDNNDIKNVSITITGTNALGATVTGTFATANNTAGAATHATPIAFKTITSITIPKMDGAGARVSVGFGTQFGLPFTSPENTVLQACVSGVRETTFPTVTYDGTDIEKNTIAFNSAPNGTADYSVYLFWPCYQSAAANTQW